jgi:hypothetical protein
MNTIGLIRRGFQPTSSPAEADVQLPAAVEAEHVRALQHIEADATLACAEVQYWSTSSAIPSVA